jgi:phosphoserine phosphatase RsbU/P
MRCMEVWGGSRRFESAVCVPGIDAWVISQPHNGADCGGDLHYISLCAGGKIARFVLADAAGHGSGAADLSGTMRSCLRRSINTHSQSRMARSLNRRLLRLCDDGRFTTAVFATYFEPRRQLTWCNAGHPVPLWFSASTGRWQWLEGAASHDPSRALNLPLGITESEHYAECTVHLETNDLVLLYTDALIEAQDVSGRLLGRDGLLRLLNRISPADPACLVSQLLAAIASHRCNRPAADDVTAMLLHHHGRGKRRIGLTERAGAAVRMLGLAKVG